MKPREFVKQRQGQYLRETLQHFERHIEPRLGPQDALAIEDFKEWCRRRFGALGADCRAVLDLGPDAELNPLGIEIRESLGAPPA
jgi:hypothetical protein